MLISAITTLNVTGQKVDTSMLVSSSERSLLTAIWKCAISKETNYRGFAMCKETTQPTIEESSEKKTERHDVPERPASLEEYLAKVRK